MAVVTITRGRHSGGETVAEEVAQAIGARCVSREVLIEAAKHYHIPENKIEGVFEKTPSFWERMTESRRTYLAFIQATLADFARDDNLVYHGSAGQELLREVPHVLKVRLLYPVEQRVQTIMELFHQTREQAERYVQQIDDDRTKRMRYLFNQDWRDPSRYDLWMRMERITKEEAVALILHVLEQPTFKLTPERRQAFDDYILKCQIYAQLAAVLVGRLSLVTVLVKDCVVTLQGTLTSHESMIEHIVHEIEQLPGVKEVHNEIVVGLVYHEWNV